MRGSRFRPVGVLALVALAFVIFAFPNNATSPVAALAARVSSLVSPAEPVAFTRSDADGPVRWRTCEPIPVVVNAGPAGDAGFDAVVAALDEIGALTGLRFAATRADVVPRSDWAVASPYAGIPPVAVAWLHADQTDLLSAGQAGSTVANPAPSGSGRRIVTGAVVLNADRLDEFSFTSGTGLTVRNLLLHELGHLVGLDHARSGLMAPRLSAATGDGFSARELDALASLTPTCD